MGNEYSWDIVCFMDYDPNFDTDRGCNACYTYENICNDMFCIKVVRILFTDEKDKLGAFQDFMENLPNWGCINYKCLNHHWGGLQ